MLPLSFKKKFDIDFANALYQHLHAHDTSVTLTLRTNSGKITNDVNKAGIGEIRNTDNKRIILMSSAEGEIYLKNAGDLQSPLLGFLREQKMGQTDLDAGLGAICIAIYIMLVICAGFLYSSDSGMPFLYPVLLTCLGATLTGLALLSYACKPGQGAWSIPGMIILIAGALPTAPSSLLVKPMIKVLGRQKLQLLLRQETVNSNNNSEETRLIN